MITGNLICLGPVGTNSGKTLFVAAPYACHLEKIVAVSQQTGMNGETVVAKNGIGGTTIGTATFATDVAGEIAAYVAADADQEIAKDGIIEIVISTLDAEGDRVHVELVLDPYRLQPA